MLFGSKKSSLREQDYALKDTFFLFHFKVQSLKVLKTVIRKNLMSLRSKFAFFEVVRFLKRASALLRGWKSSASNHLFMNFCLFQPIQKISSVIARSFIEVFWIQVYCFCLFFVRQFSSFPLSDQMMKPESVYPMKLKIM